MYNDVRKCKLLILSLGHSLVYLGESAYCR